MDKIKKAYAIRELRGCYDTHGIVAGRHHFSDYWGRDGFFACFGALALGDYKIAEKMVDLFYSHQNSRGLIPYRLMNAPITLGQYLGKERKRYEYPRPTYKLRNIYQEVFDGTTLAVIFLSKLGLMGRKISKERIQQTKKAFTYLEKKEKYGLLWDGIMAEWNDSADKFGNLLYSNIIYWYSLDQFNKLLKKRGEQGASLVKKQEDVAKAIRGRLWNGKYFADWNDYKRQDYFYPYGNLLAVTWGFTSRQESEAIIEECNRVKIAFTLETNSPAYPFWRIDLLQHLIGMGNYQNKSMLWWQPAAAYVAALNKLGKKKEAKKQIELMSEQILKYNGVYECYERNGKPVQKLLYKSEQPFAWSAGMFIWAAGKA